MQALAITILHLLCREGKYTEAAAALGELVTLMDRFEPKAHHLYYLYSACFSRMVSLSVLSYSIQCLLLQNGES